MSWNLSVQPVPFDGFAEAVRAAEPNVGEFGADEMHDQVAAAKSAMEAILESGALGRSGCFVANASGHANPEHEITSGWANDQIAVSVYRSE